MPPTSMVRDKLRGNNEAVINARLIRECVHVTNIPLTEDARGGGRGYGDRSGHDKQAMYLKNLALNLELHNVTCVMLSHQNVGKIDNLVGLPSLTKLHLDNNNIKKIENLSHLTKLEWLDLSFNSISVIEGLEALTELRDLSLYSNLIDSVRGLDTLTKLQCLSLGVNQIENLDETARYLHKLQSLRMLTLSGNRIASLKVYKQRIVAFVGSSLRYLDSRLVLPKEYSEAKEDQNEALSSVIEEDEKAKIAADEAVAQQKEVTEAHLRNTIVPSALVPELDAVRVEGASIAELLQIDLIRERTKDCIERYEQINTKAQEFYQQMSELYFKKKNDRDGFWDSLKWYGSTSDEECKQLIYQYEQNVKQVIPYGLRAQPTMDALGGGGVDLDGTYVLREMLSDLKDDLMEKEADQFDAFSSAISVFEDKLKEFYEKMGKELIGARFEDFRRLEKEYVDGIKSAMTTWFEEKARNEGGTINQTVPIDIQRLLDSKEECQKALGEIGDARTKRLDELEEALKKNEDSQWRLLLEEAQSTEQARGRARIAEIVAYVRRQEEHLNQWDAAIDAMSA